MLDAERNLIFIHIARTGGTSIESALMGADWWEIDAATKHLSASQSRRLYGEELWQRCVKFSVVRNPWDRLVSMWATGWWWDSTTHLQGEPPASMQRFIETLRPHPHERYDTVYYHQILDESLDPVLRFENLEEDFAALLARNGLPPVRLPHVERRDRRPYRDYYDMATRELVGELFARDISDYGYEF